MNKTGVFIAIFLLIIIVFLAFFAGKPIRLNSTATEPIKNIEPDQKEFLDDIENLTSTAGGTFSVYIYDINKKEEYGIHPQTVITAASLNKTAILAALYYLAGKNEIDLEKIITLQKGDIQDFGSGSIRYDPPGTVYSIKTLARLMMEKSDNTAAYILANQIIGIDKIQQLVDSWGMAQTNIADNKTSAKDMSLLMIKMYKGEITTQAFTLEMLDFMKKSDYDDRIPAGLPEGTVVYHKTGDEINKVHDIAIVDLKDRPYYLGILTTDMTDVEKTEKIIAQISKIVYEAMSGNNLR